jgi:hypothetical protein
MKLFFDSGSLKDYLFGTGESIKFGLGWYRHHKSYKYFGITFQFYLYFWLVNMTFVSDYNEYDKRINRRRDPDHMKKLGEKLKAIREKK